MTVQFSKPHFFAVAALVAITALTAFSGGCQRSVDDDAPSVVLNENSSSEEKVTNGDIGLPAIETQTTQLQDQPAQSTHEPTHEPTPVENQSFSMKILCWNIESEGSDPNVIAEELTALGAYDIYALTEFLPTAEKLFGDTLGDNYELIMSRSGRNDRLAIAFDVRLFELVKVFEIAEINFQNRYRSPMVVLLKDKRSGIQFQIMNNHLARGKEQVRQKQAQQLVQWARTQLLPTVAVGDYNLDYVFATQQGNSAFPMMMKDNVWKWIPPVEMIDTNWYDNPRQPDGLDDYPGSLLDFAFVTGPAKDWKSFCRVIVRQGDFPDDETTSDHRPFELMLSY